MKSIPEATPIVLTGEERAELEGLARSMKSEHRERLRARIVLMASDEAATREIAPNGRLHDRHGVQMAGPLRGATDGGVSTTRASGARSPNTGLSTTRAFWRFSIGRRRKATPIGAGPCCPRLWATSTFNMSGGFCAPRRSTFPAANPGAKATIPTSWPRRPRSSGSTWRRRKTPSCWPSTKSPRSRRSNGRKAT